MMQLQERQLDSSSLLNEYTRLAGCQPREQSAILSVVFAKDNNGSWRYFLGHCELISEASIAPAEIVYPSFAFIRRKILNFSLSEFLSALVGEGFRISEELPPLKKSDALSISWIRGLIPSHATKCEFPVVRYTNTLENGLSFQDGLLIAFDLPYVESASEYLKKFLHMDGFHGSSDSRKGEFSIGIRDYFARINFNDDTLSLSLGCCFSVGPAMLASKKGLALAAKIPRDRVLTETDGLFFQIDGRSVFPWETENALPFFASLWSVSEL